MSTLAPKEGEINMRLLLTGDGKIVANDMERAQDWFTSIFHWLDLPM